MKLAMRNSPVFQKMTKKAKIDALSPADKRMAAMLIKRDAFDLAKSLSPLTGSIIAHYIFSVKVNYVNYCTKIRARSKSLRF